MLAAAALFAPGVLLISRPHIALLSVRPTESSLRYQADLRRDLPRAVDLAGGPAALISCGPIQTNPSEAPLTAWTLGLELASITGSRRRRDHPVAQRGERATAAGGSSQTALSARRRKSGRSASSCIAGNSSKRDRGR